MELFSASFRVEPADEARVGRLLERKRPAWSWAARILNGVVLVGAGLAAASEFVVVLGFVDLAAVAAGPWLRARRSARSRPARTVTVVIDEDRYGIDGPHTSMRVSWEAITRVESRSGFYLVQLPGGGWSWFPAGALSNGETRSLRALLQARGLSR